MATKKKSTKKNGSKSLAQADNKIVAATALVFAGACIGYIGTMQGQETELLLLGFGSALAFLGAVLLGMAISPVKK